MKEIIEKYKKGELTVGELGFDKIQKGDEITSPAGSKFKIVNLDFPCRMDKVNVSLYLEKEIAAMEKQPTEYEYEKVEFDKAWVAAKVHEERDMELWRQSDLNDAIKGNNWKAIQSPSEAAQYHFDLYRRIELTPEQLHERKVEELAEIIKPCTYERGGISHIDAARLALEWMESKGK